MAQDLKIGRVDLVPSKTRRLRDAAHRASIKAGAGAGADIVDVDGTNSESAQIAAFAQLDISPVFLHSSFRTSSTWLWSKLRATANAMAYYEIFHEGLAGFNAKSVSAMTYQGWDSKHPPMGPYFIEFLPLLQEGGGIPGFSSTMALESFIPAGGLEGEVSAAERAYVELLISNAYASRKIPVLSCTRTLGRAGALRRAFGGRAVFCHRNLFHQWASYAGQAVAGNPYFLHSIDTTLKAARHDPFLALVDDWSAGRTISPTDEKLFQAFLLLHLYLSAHAYDASDLVVDVTAMAGDPALRRKVEGELSQMVSAPVDLSDVRVSFDMSPLPLRSADGVMDTVAQFSKIIRATCRSEAAADFVEAVRDDALSEWQRHEFFTRGARQVHGAQLADANRRAEEAVGAAGAAGAARDALAAQVHDLASARDALTQQVGEGQAALALLQQNLDAAALERSALAERIGAVEAERDALRGEAATAAAHASALAAQIGDLAAARDGLTQQVNDGQAALDLLQHSSDAERSALAEHIGMVEAERDALAHRVGAAEAERAVLAERLVVDVAEMRTALASMTESRDAVALQLRTHLETPPPAGILRETLSRLRRLGG